MICWHKSRKRKVLFKNRQDKLVYKYDEHQEDFLMLLYFSLSGSGGLIIACTENGMLLSLRMFPHKSRCFVNRQVFATFKH